MPAPAPAATGRNPAPPLEPEGGAAVTTDCNAAMEVLREAVELPKNRAIIDHNHNQEHARSWKAMNKLK